MSRLAENGNWDEDFKVDEKGKRANSNTSSNDQGKAQYVTWNKTGDYKIRLIGPHVKCRKHFKPYRATVQDDEKNIDPAWLAGFFPQQRFAINVIDRTDGKLKILEKPWSVFEHFANYKSVFKKDPAAVKGVQGATEDGPDFLVKVTIPNGDDGKPDPLKTTYSVIHLADAPLTPEEKQMIKTQKLWPLREIYKSTPADKMKELWDALPAEKKVAPKRKDKQGNEIPAKGSTPAPAKEQAKPAPAPIEEKMPEAPANSDNLFEDNTAEASADGASLF